MAKKKEVTNDEMIYSNDFPSLNSLLVKNDKRGLFTQSAISIGYPTGFLPLDYRNGYKTNIYDVNGRVIDSYNNIGIFGGTFNTVIGKTGTAKTTLVAQISANILKYCLSKYKIPVEIYHKDVEQASTYTRIKNVTGLPVKLLKELYHIDRSSVYIEDIYDSIEELVEIKESYKDTFMVDTGIQDEFGDYIRTYVPTILIIDSLPSIATKEAKDEKGLKTGTYANRVAKSISRFYKQMMPLIYKYNIIVFVINHINTKIDIGPIPTSPQTMYLKMDESIPGGFAPLYYAHNIFKIVMDKKLSTEAKSGKSGDEVDGFCARIELLKSRSNKAGKFCKLIYDQETGFDPYLSLYEYLNTEKGLIGGRNPYRFINGYEELKFDDRNLREALESNEELRNALVLTGVINLQELLSRPIEESENSINIMDIYDSLNKGD